MPSAAAAPLARTRIVEHRSDDVSWRMLLRRPEVDLAADVVRLHAYREHGTGHVVRRELPSGLATMVFNLGQNLGVGFPGETPTVFRAGGAFFSGLGTRYATTETHAGQDGVQVMLTALGARRLLGMPLGEVGDRLVAPSDLFGPDAREWCDRLCNMTGEEQRLALLEATLNRRLREAPELPSDLVFAVRRFSETRGRIGVAALAEEMGCSRRHLGRRFTLEFGLPPKLFARLLRFDAAVQELKEGRVGSWADLAVLCGYADQAHLSRDFAEFAGDPPSVFATRRLAEGGFAD